jgi:hypothetical protein
LVMRNVCNEGMMKYDVNLSEWMRVLGHGDGEVVRLGNCEAWCFAGLCSGSLVVKHIY